MGSTLQTIGTTVHAAVMTERKPKDAAWHKLFEALSVVVIWPELMMRAPVVYRLPQGCELVRHKRLQQQRTNRLCGRVARAGRRLASGALT